METAHACRTDELKAHFNVKLEEGLSSAKAKEALAKYGPNELPAEVGKPLWQLILEQFDDLLVKVRSLVNWLCLRGGDCYKRRDGCLLE